MAKILLIEDDATLVRTLKNWLTLEHHNVEAAESGTEGLEKLRFYQYDLVILDLELPGMGGMEVLSEFRSLGGKTPILILSGRSSIEAKELGLDAGADDYLTKPFHVKELSARMRALWRRPPEMSDDVIKIGNIEIDHKSHKVTKDGAALNLLA